MEETIKNIIKRDIIEEIIKYLDTDNIIVLHGARQVGKTHIFYYLQDWLRAAGKPSYYFDLEDSRFVELLESGPEATVDFLKGSGVDIAGLIKQSQTLYVFIDEIQRLSQPSPFLKLVADHYKYLRLIVSGSSSFDIKSKFSDSLVGRTVDFEIFNLSFREFLRFKQRPFDLKVEPAGPILDQLKRDYEEYVAYGGYPKVVLENDREKKEKYLQQIIDTYIQKDVRDLAQVRDVRKFNNLLKILASMSGQLLRVAELAKSCRLAQATVEHYLLILENTYVIKLLPPFSLNAKVEVVKAPKIFFYDTGLLQMLWFKKLSGSSQAGNVFETSVFAELVKHYGADPLHYWRTKSQAEVDFILNERGQMRPFEVKMNFNNFHAAAVQSFCEKYHLADYWVVGLAGERRKNNFIYPWQV
ncbi:MAG: ATP-binding protein [Patescibacteria group bacterium]